MGRPLRFMSWIGSYVEHRLYWRSYCRGRYQGKETILARHACLGTDVLRLLQPAFRAINVQKGRVDYLVDCWRDPQRRARTLPVIAHMQREEIIGCVMQEEMLYDWIQPQRPVVLFMDSMAEHADQRFVHRSNGWSFLCSYTDLAHTEQFRRVFAGAGLLPVDDLSKHFGTFFEEFRSRFGRIPIFYLHFPVKLEERQKFRERHRAIRQAIDGLSTEFQPLYSLAVDEAIVDRDEDRTASLWDFPYHYNKKTYEVFADLVRATGVWPG